MAEGLYTVTECVARKETQEGVLPPIATVVTGCGDCYTVPTVTLDVALILLILIATIVLFLVGHWRHDVVAMMALVISVLVGLVPHTTAFAGFGSKPRTRAPNLGG